jgi:hypothetical protein
MSPSPAWRLLKTVAIVLLAALAAPMLLVLALANAKERR